MTQVDTTTRQKARKRSLRSFAIALVIVGSTLGIATGIGVCVVKRALDYPNRPHKGQGIEVVIEVKPGMTFPEIASMLADKNIIDKPSYFRLYATHRGVSRRIRPGKYKVRDDWTPKQVLDKLLTGVKRRLVRVTIPEGRHMLEVFELFKKARVVASTDELVRLARDPEFLRSQGITASSVEGYLFPETYRFATPTPAKKILHTLIRQFRLEWARIKRRHAASLRKLNKKLEWTDHQVLIMASIVEKEAILAHERRTIAQVFINRLTDPKFKPQRLETDPTIRYGCMVPEKKSAACRDWLAIKDPKTGRPLLGRLRRAQLRDDDNSYNTYRHEGLPPGPIANPGRHALEATVTPDGSKHIYFVARGDCTHRHWFSRTRRQHERRVKQFLANRRKHKDKC